MSSVSGLSLPPIGANAPSGLAAFVARACSGWLSENEPLTSRPLATALGSPTLRVALAAVLVTVAATDVSY